MFLKITSKFDEYLRKHRSKIYLYSVVLSIIGIHVLFAC